MNRLHPAEKSVQVSLVVDLLGYRLILDDGSGDELGEEGDVKPHL